MEAFFQVHPQILLPTQLPHLFVALGLFALETATPSAAQTTLGTKVVFLFQTGARLLQVLFMGPLERVVHPTTFMEVL